MQSHIGSLALLLCLAASTSAFADSLAAGEKASTLCAGCHGPGGISTNPLWPNLAGQKDQYLVKTLHDYRDGQRSDPVMSPIAQTLTDEEIAALAAYYAGLNSGG